MTKSTQHEKMPRYFSFYQQIRRQILLSFVMVLFAILLLGSYSYQVNSQNFAQNKQQFLQDFLTAQSARLQSQWQTLKHQSIDQQKQWLSVLQLPNTQITLTHPHTNQVLLKLENIQVSTNAPLNLNNFTYHTTISHTIALDANTQLTLQQNITSPTTYINFMTRPLLAIIFVILIVGFFLGRWAKQKQYTLNLLQQAIQAFQQQNKIQTHHLIQQIQYQTPYQDEITETATALQKMSDELTKLHTQIQKDSQVLTLLKDAVIELNSQYRILHTNSVWQDIQQQTQIHTHNFLDYLVKKDRVLWIQTVENALQHQKTTFKIQFRLNDQAKHAAKWYEGRFMINTQNPKAPTFIGILQNIHHSHLQEQKMQYLALHDPLTTLPNRTLLEDRLQHAITQAKRHQNAIAILFLDLDHFKQINDTLGHSIGDQLLKQVAQRIRHQLRAQDTVARWGGDEFVILLPEIINCQGTLKVAHKILKALHKNFQLDHETLTISATIGISCYPEDGQNQETLFAKADKAMFYAKQQGRNQAILYQEHQLSIQSNIKPNFPPNLTHALSQAIKHKKIMCYYQPIINSQTGQVISVEALARWKKDGQFISPEIFIGLAEEMGLICELGHLILEQSLTFFKSMQGQLPSIHINVSPKQLFTDHFYQSLQTLTQKLQIDPKSVILEITESIAIQEVELAYEQLKKIQQAGFKTALDDFGTGYASLSQLSELKPNKLKIDRIFINQIHTRTGRDILESIIKIGHTLNMEIVAEGVETETQKQLLCTLNTNHLQGYLIAKPLPENEFTQWLKDQTPTIQTS